HERAQHRERTPDSHQKAREAVSFARDRNFEREAVVDERALVRDALRRGMGEINYAQVRSSLAARLASGEFRQIDDARDLPGRRFTTARVIEAEKDVIHRMQEGKGRTEPLMPPQELAAVSEQHHFLNRAQRAAIEEVLGSTDRIHGIQGYAGAGKTTVLSALRETIEAQDYDVHGLAPTSRAARQLNEAGIPSGTLQGFLAASSPNAANSTEKHYYFVDESSLAGTRQMREFLARLGPGDRVLLIGDTRQHQSVEAGRPFEQLQQAGMRAAKLDEIVRQKDPALKSAVEMLARGQSGAAIIELKQQGRVQEIAGREERIRAVAHAYAESPERTLIVSPDNASRRELNSAVRKELRADGSVTGQDRPLRVLIQRQDMTGADRAWANHYETSDVVRYSRGSKTAGIEAASYATVTAIDPSQNLLTVQKESGEVITYDPRRLTGVSVYREAMHDFAVGDRIQFTAPDKSLGVANRDLAVIESIAPDDRIAARLDDNRHIEFNPAEHRHFDHGYAVTSHSAQGLTSERVLIHADTSVHPDLLSSRFGYVAVSRTSHETTIFTDDLNRFGHQLSAEVNKTSALEISQASSIGIDQGLGIV
ncbi:MAG TPA: AAA family ATPase, partial [Candidatus Sulfotelmatobacter sp.]|nr:AAA family ATPase [Candidatus Sulfotelmatobacter sp.]